MRKLFYTLGLVGIILISACSNNEPSPNDRMEKYVQLWHENAFTEMYEMLSEDTINTFPTDEFIDRYEKVYTDLEIEDLEITYSELDKDDVAEALEEGVATYSLQVNMNSMAGPIQFEKDIHLHFVQDSEDEEEQDWYVEWNPGFIFPEVEDGGKIRIETEQAKRGEILDRNQMPLAINDVAYEIGVVPNQFENEESEKEQIANLLHISVDTIDQSLQASWVEDDHFVPLKIIPKTAENTFTELLNIPAVTYLETSGRIYPSGEAAAHLTGYIGQVTAEEIEEFPERNYKESDVIGKRGLEQLYEEKLRGEDGVKIKIEKQNGGSTDETVLAEKPVKHGEHVQVTIDINIQERIFSEYDEKSGTAAAIQPKTGEVLALISSPSFDPNELTYGVSQTEWDALMEDEDQPFINRFTATFAPGSAIKPITSAIGLTNGTIKPDEGIDIEGLTWAKENWSKFKVRRVSESDKPVDLHSAITRSDNIYFAMKALEMGPEAYIEGLKQFGLEESLPIEYPFSVSQISNDGTLNDEILLANTSYGQGEIELSSLHMALAYTPFLNSGNMIKPSFLMDAENSEVWKENVVSKENAELMQTYLRD